MKKTIDRKTQIIIMVLAVVVLIVLKMSGIMHTSSGIKIGFVGNTLPHRVSGSYAEIRGKLTYTLTPSSGSKAIECEIGTSSGNLNVKVLDYKSKEVIFEKEIDKDETFTVNTDKKVKIVLETKQHSGSFLFTY